MYSQFLNIPLFLYAPVFAFVQAAVQENGDTLLGLFAHVENELETDAWSVLVWSKAATFTDDDSAALVTPKIHIVRLDNLVVGAPLRSIFGISSSFNLVCLTLVVSCS